ncbi:MAG TPA: DUF2927 domain-containing protein [Vineibacter sp.]|nr:DUF2927 domain-containing protein [Vineibacter sp.]
MSLREAVQAFDEAALRIDTAPASELARWTSPIFLAISDQSGMAAYAADVEAVVRAFGAVTRVPVNRVDWRDPRANFFVRANTGDTPGKSPCRSSVDWTDNGSMVRADIHVNLANPGRITRCINHEVMHGFGFRGHAHSVFSVLSYRHADQAYLTDTDRLILESLYDPRLRAGMSVPATSAAACGIMAEKLSASASDTAALCEGRGMVASRRRTITFAGSARAADQQAASLPSLHPGYRDGM